MPCQFTGGFEGCPDISWNSRESSLESFGSILTLLLLRIDPRDNMDPNFLNPTWEFMISDDQSHLNWRGNTSDHTLLDHFELSHQYI